MLDHEITTENFSEPEDVFLPNEYNTEYDFPKLLEKNCTPQSKLFRSISLYDIKPLDSKTWDDVRSCHELSHLSSELLSHSSAAYERTSTAEEIKRIEIAYNNVMEKFLLKMDKFMFSVWKMRDKLIKSLKEFQIVSRNTAHVILGSSMLNFAVVVGSLLHKMFHFSWNSKFLLIPTVTGAISLTTSLLTFSYMKQTTNEFSKDLRKENRLLRDLIIAHRKGDWLDEKVSKLFPHGININLIDQKVLEQTYYLRTKNLRKNYLCSKIIQSNIKEDKNLLKNEEFLIRVKLFVENPVADIWWSRMRIKKILEEARQKADNTSVKDFLSSHEDIMYRTALYVYPAFLPWLASSRTPKEMRFIFTSLSGILAALDLKNDGSEELDKLKKMYLRFEKDFKEIYKICEILDGSEE